MTENQPRSFDPSGLLDRLDSSGFTPRHGRIYAAALAGHFFDGFLIYLTGVVLPGAVVSFHLTRTQVSYFSSALFAGMLVGAVIAGIVSDRLGRKLPLALCILIYAVFSLLAAFAWNYPSLTLFRACQGAGLGAEIAVVLPYIAEFAPARHRASMMTTATAVWLTGLPAAASLGTWLVPHLTWRAMFVVGALPIAVSVFMALWLPESVRCLLLRGRHDAARQVVDSLATGPARPTADAGAAPVPSVGSPAGSARGPSGWGRAVLAILDRRYARYTISLWFMELCAGAFLYGMATYLPLILEKRGVGLLDSFSYTAIISAVGVAGSIVAGQIINRVGRRWTIALSFLAGGGFCLWWGAVSGTASIAVLGSAATFFGSGLAGSTLFTYASELYPTAGRATGLGWAAGWQKAGGLAIPSVTGFILELHSSNYLFFVLFGGISVLAGIAALAATYETRNKTVEQIADELDLMRLSREKPGATSALSGLT